MEMGSLISHAMGRELCSTIAADEYLTGDNSLPVCVDIDGNDWDENWLRAPKDEDEEEYFDVNMHIKAMESLENNMTFLEVDITIEAITHTSCRGSRT